MELAPEFQANPAALAMLYVRSRKGELVPLSSLATITQNTGPLDGDAPGPAPGGDDLVQPASPASSLGDAVAAVERDRAPDAAGDHPDATSRARRRRSRARVQGLGLLLIVAIVVIYMVLGILYESFIHPITILTALPFAGFGALVTLMIFHTELSIYAFVGIIMLVGLVKKNGIMMVDFAIEAQRNEGMPPQKAIYEACLVRFRPIMMTTMAALMGTLPIALGFGAGAESRRPLGLAVVGGLLFSQTLTLYVTPVFYIYMDRLQTALRRSQGQGREPQEGGGPAAIPSEQPAPAAPALRLSDV